MGKAIGALGRLGSLALCALALASCGSGSGSAPSSGAGIGPGVGAPLTLADCGDWNQADVAQRLATIAALGDFAGGPVGDQPGGHGAVLEDKNAYNLLNGYCSSSFARGFKLYKLYTRAAAFQGLAQ